MRLIVVSNRVSTPSKAGSETVGGLALALHAALKEYRGLWFGWSGQITDVFNGQINMSVASGVRVATVDLEENDVAEYYNGYANRTLWPLFHHRIDLTAYDRAFGDGYDRVNRRFAETLIPLLEPDDLIWVHDYHLIPLARELRARGIQNPIGFFLHIPWPARQLLTTLPKHQRLVEALFDYDLIGFQTAEWLDSFQTYIVREVGGELVDDGVIKAFGKRTEADAFPIGLDARAFAALANSATAKRMRDRVTKSSANRTMIVGVDRLDYSKGLEERFISYEEFLQRHTAQRGKVFFLQIAPTSREDVESYQDIRRRLEAVSGRINGAFAEPDWVPLRYVNRSYRRDELAGLYRAARVGLVTPMRDGMNLVAKEYVAAQDPNDPGVLILSQFAGAAAQLEDALIVNPFSAEEVSEAIARAIGMDRDERVRRWRTMMDNVQRADIGGWRDAFVAALQRTCATRTHTIDASASVRSAHQPPVG